MEMMGNWDYPQDKKADSFAGTLLCGLRVIGIGLLYLAGLSVLSMGFVIAFMDACGAWTFEWWHLIYWVTELFVLAFLIGKMWNDV